MDDENNDDDDGAVAGPLVDAGGKPKSKTWLSSDLNRFQFSCDCSCALRCCYICLQINE